MLTVWRIRWLAATAVCANLSAQAPAPRFDAASVKLAIPAGRGRGGLGPWGIKTGPGMLTVTNIKMSILIHYAFSFLGNPEEERQILGAPTWVDEQTYDITAKAPGPATRDELMLMLRTLLADRFHLAFHWQSKDAWTYALVVAKGGIKFHESPAERSPPRPGLLQHLTMPAFAAMLMGSDATEHTQAIDHTGLTGTYDLDLGTLPLEPGHSVVDAWVEVMPRQLGLELERERGSLKFLVIDKIDRIPSEN